MAEQKGAPYTGTIDVVLEYDGSQYAMDAVMEKAKADYKAQHGKKPEDLKLYVKPSDGKAYYTAEEGRISGSVDL